jgi:hypothetical protein
LCRSSFFPAAAYLWLIDNSEDTTVGANLYTYDRIVAFTASAEDSAGPGDVYRYDRVLDMGSVGADDISDHYPVEAVFWTGRDTD